MYNNIKNNKILRNKFNQGGERPVHWKLWETLMKEFEEGTNKWKYIPCSWTKTVIIVNVHTTQSRLKIHPNPYQVSNGKVYR